MAVRHMRVTPHRSMRQPSVRILVSSGAYIQWEKDRGGKISNNTKVEHYNRLLSRE